MTASQLHDKWITTPGNRESELTTWQEMYAAMHSPTWLARHVRPGWHMAGVGVITSIYTRTTGQVTFYGPDGYRTFDLDTFVQAQN